MKTGALMADISSISMFKKPTSFPRLFTLKNYSESTDSMMSPTSILDTKPFFSTLKNPFFSDPNPSIKSPDSDLRRTWDNQGVGLGIVDVLNDHNSGTNLSQPETRIVQFGSQLKIQIPTTESLKSPADFGIKTRNWNSQLGSSSSANSGMDTPTGCLSAIEMELSEDYTCVISYGPNPKTTHIFDDCVIESCCGIVEFSASKTEDDSNDGSSFCSDSFLSSCFTCKKNLGHGKDIYIYRGEKSFCSIECRHQEMMLEEKIHGIDTQ